MRTGIAKSLIYRPRLSFHSLPIVSGGGGGGGGGGPEPTGIGWRTMTSAYWDYVELMSSLTGVGFALGGLGAPSYRNRIANIEATLSGGTIVNPGDNLSSAVGGVSTGGLVRMNGGSYTLSSSIPLDGKRLVTVPGAQVTIDAGAVDNAVNMRATGGVLAGVGAGSYIKVINGGNVGVVAFDVGDGQCKNNDVYRVWVDDMGNSPFNTTDGTGLSLFYDSKNGLAVNFQVTNGTDDYAGGNCDGVHGSNNNDPNAMNAFLYGWSYRNSDDGLDVWSSNAAQLIIGMKLEEQARHPTHPAGDGNGVKFGGNGASVKHIVGDSDSINNGRYAWDRNSNGTPPSIYASRQSGNLAGDYAGGIGLYDVFSSPGP